MVNEQSVITVLVDDDDLAVCDACDSDLERGIRSEYELPNTLVDPEAEAVLSEAVGSVVTENCGDPIKTLAATFTTLCETDTPELEDCGTGQQAACHLVDPVPRRQDSPILNEGSSIIGVHY